MIQIKKYFYHFDLFSFTLCRAFDPLSFVPIVGESLIHLMVKLNTHKIAYMSSFCPQFPCILDLKHRCIFCDSPFKKYTFADQRINKKVQP